MSGYGEFSYYYDILNVDAQYERRAEFIRSLLLKHGCGGGILLDLACGTGEMTELFSRMGFEMIGTDASEEMLSVAREKSLKSGSDILYLCQRMQELDLFGTVDGCVCTLDSINHLPDGDAVRRVFDRVALFLNEGGPFIFDVNTPFKHRNVLADNTFVYDVDDVFCVWQNSTDSESLITDIKLDVFERDDEDEAYYRTEEQFSERAYPLESLKEWLDEADFEIIGVFNEFEETPPGENAERVVFVCKNRRSHSAAIN